MRALRTHDDDTGRTQFAAGVGIVLVAIASMLGGCGGAAATPVDQATDFWEAVASSDREAAVAAIDPAALETGEASTFGRGDSMVSKFDWYDAVGWEWSLEKCVAGDADSATCTATAHNAWSDALGVEPVTGTFELQIGENGITRIDDPTDSFISQWSPQVFEVFADWVFANYPDDALIMFDFSLDLNDEIVELYRVNTERFVAAQTG